MIRTILEQCAFCKLVLVVAQEYVTSMQANLVRSLMNLVEMLIKEAATKEDAKENKHIRVWLTVFE